MAMTITDVQRAAIYDDVIHELTGVGDIFICLQQGDIDDAQRIRRRCEADMRLLDDLGWAEGDPRGRFELTMPALQLQRTLGRLSAIAAARLRDACQPPDESVSRIAHAAAIADAGYDELLEAASELIGGAA
jgi:hypothetical protein